MPQLTLRLQEDDVRLFDEASRVIAGPKGAPFVGRTTVIRRALEAFVAPHREPPAASREKTA